MSELVEHAPRLGPIAPPEPDPRRRRSSPRRLAVVLGAAITLAVALVLFFLLRGRDARSEAPKVAPAAQSQAVELTPELRAAAGIAIEHVMRGPLAPLVTVVGEAAFDPTSVAAVGTRAPGIVQKVFFVEGDHVEQGELLARIEAPGLAEAQADEQIAKARRSAALLNADREAKLFARGLTTAREYEQAKAELVEQEAREKAARERVVALGGAGASGVSELRAPVSGIIAERTLAPGQSVQPGHVAFRVGSVERLWVLLRVYERHLQVLRRGDPVQITPVASPETVIEGHVAHVGSVIDPATHTADVRVEVDNEDLRLRPGQLVKAQIRANGPGHVALSVPASALTSVDGVPTVFVAETDDRFIARRVELGIDGGDRIEIRTGLFDGERVVTRGVLALKSELFR